MSNLKEHHENSGEVEGESPVSSSTNGKLLTRMNYISLVIFFVLGWLIPFLEPYSSLLSTGLFNALIYYNPALVLISFTLSLVKNNENLGVASIVNGVFSFFILLFFFFHRLLEYVAAFKG